MVGEAGVGKTRLAEHPRAAADRADIAAVTGRALPEVGSSLLRPFAEVLLEVTRDRPAPAEDDLAPLSGGAGLPDSPLAGTWPVGAGTHSGAVPSPTGTTTIKEASPLRPVQGRGGAAKES